MRTKQQHSRRTRLDSQTLGDLLAAHLLEAGEAKNLGLSGRQLAYGGPQSIHKLIRLSVTG